MGVGGWQPQVISKATSELGQGIDRLGAGVEDLDTSQTQQNNQLQQAQARAAVLSQTTGALAKLPSLTDAGQVSDLRNNIDSTVQQAASTFKDPRQAALFTADITPHIAETYAHFDGRAREINNQNSLANYDTTTTSTINNAATIDDDNLSSSALQGVNSHVQALQDGGVITPTEAFQYRQNATKSYVEARYAYLEQWADTHNEPRRTARSTRISPRRDGRFLPPSTGLRVAGGTIAATRHQGTRRSPASPTTRGSKRRSRPGSPTLAKPAMQPELHSSSLRRGIWKRPNSA
jgi:multidrug efflux pump subunit AcrA (membrane-fusion protein)